jgi:hypothetical protein
MVAGWFHHPQSSLPATGQHGCMFVDFIPLLNTEKKLYRQKMNSFVDLLSLLDEFFIALCTILCGIPSRKFARHFEAPPAPFSLLPAPFPSTSYPLSPYFPPPFPLFPTPFPPISRLFPLFPAPFPPPSRPLSPYLPPLFP